mgnify:CR=1 FL=1
MFTYRFYPALNFALTLILAAAFSTVTSAGTKEDEIASRLSDAIPQIDITGVSKSEAPGLYEVSSSNGGTIFVTADGQYLMTGDMLKVTANGIANLSEEKRLVDRVETLNSFGHGGLISYPAKGKEKASLAVFTDIDCPYCRKFHGEVPQLNELGISVHYYAFPRSGPNTPSFAKYESVWCSDDQQSAMDAAKQGRSIDRKTCENPVGEQYRLGQQVGVTGTPAIILENGRIVPGYRPAKQMAEAAGVL